MRDDRKIDIAVATKVMGHTVVKAKTLDLDWKGSSIPPFYLVAGIEPGDLMLGDTAKPGWAEPLPGYATDIRTAWNVVIRLGEKYHAVLRTPFEKGSKKYSCGFTPLGCTGWNGRPDIEAIEKTMELAICKAALLAVGKKAHYLERADGTDH